MKTMNDLFLHFLQDIYYAEKASARALTKVLRTVENADLKAMVQNGKDNAHAPIERLDRVFEAAGKRPRGKACEAMNGLITEIQEAIEEGEKGPVLDAAIIAGLQGIKHYEMTRYGSLKSFAKTLGLDEAVEELQALVDAARADDEALTGIAEGHANTQAKDQGGEDEEDGEAAENEEPDAKEPTKTASKTKVTAKK